MKSMKAKWLLTLLSGTGAGLYPLLASALGLGDIQVDSRLNQTLRARIEIVGVSDEEWRLIRASIASQSVSSGDIAHPELLDSVTLSPSEDANHRHFIQVKSSSIFTEPLFDLPIEVSGPSAHVVRSYAVLLDPEETVSHAGTAVVGVAKADSTAVAPIATAARQHASRRHSGGVSKHTRSRRHAPSATPTSSTASTSRAAPASSAASPPAVTTSAVLSSSAQSGSAQGAGAEQTNARAPAPGLAQDQLERQLVTLQQTLARMQSTIAAQDAEIAKLTRAVASGAPASDASASDASAAQADSEIDSGDAAEPASFWARPGFFSRVAGGMGLAALLGALGLWLARRRKAAAARDVVVEDRYSQSSQGASKKSYQVGQPSSYEVEEHTEGSAVGSSAGAATGPDDRDGMESWRAQTALLEQDILSATGALPAATEEKDPVEATTSPMRSSSSVDDEKTLELQQTLESLEMQRTLESLEMQQTLEVRQPLDAQPTMQMQRALDSLTTRRPDGPENRDIVKTLEHTLDIEPDRVDVQLKLLEIYHHEALGNRDNFHLLLSRLKVEQDGLSPAQRSHLEMLRRTLEDSKSDADCEYPAAAAV